MNPNNPKRSYQLADGMVKLLSGLVGVLFVALLIYYLIKSMLGWLK